MTENTERRIGLFGAIGVGVGAIVGGGILALAGVAFAATGPSAILAFALNGVIALLTALSFAELAARFPESGGTYIFSKKVLSIRSAFAVGWVVWFASIMAAVLYAVGAGYFISLVLGALWEGLFGISPEWAREPWTSSLIAIIATSVYAIQLTFRPGGGALVSNIGKIIAFSVLIIGGFWAFSAQSPQELTADLTPFFEFGALGLLAAMGYTFIAFQGFDLIAAVGGEVKNPSKNIPRAMIISLLIALGIYLPLLLIITTVGTGEGVGVMEFSKSAPEAVVAEAAFNYLGKFGYWIVLVAAVLSMLSALYANLLAASHVARSMAADRTIPTTLSVLEGRANNPVRAVMVTSFIIIVTVLIVPDVASAGAAASLIFLVTFALAHLVSYLARKRRSAGTAGYLTPYFPLVPVVGMAACIALAVFQGVVVPVAGVIALLWLGLGAVLYYILFERRARIVDASAEGYDPELLRLRGKSPLVLVPIANPDNAVSMVAMANALAPPGLGRVMLLSVVTPGENWGPEDNDRAVKDTQNVLRQALVSSLGMGLEPEALTTIASRSWPEIIRVSREHKCESLLVGLTKLSDETTVDNLERLISMVDCDVVVLRAPRGWHISEANRVLVPVAGRGGHSELLARVLGSICRSGNPEVTFLRVMPESAEWGELDRVRKDLFVYAGDQVGRGHLRVKVEKNEDVAGEIIGQTTETDLIVLGLQRVSRREKVFGEHIMQIARETDCPMLLISSKR